MTIQIIYKQILKIELWHDYLLGQPALSELSSLDLTMGDTSELITLVPTADCGVVLQNWRWIFRSQAQGAGIFAAVREGPAGNFQTQIPLNQPARLTFWLVIRDRHFSNFTNLPLTPLQNTIYYFSNLANNQGHSLFLTRPLPLYTDGAEYSLGQLVTHQDKTLEAVHYQNSASATPDPGDWDTLPGTQYVAEGDRLLWQSPLRTQILPNMNPGDSFRLALVDASDQETFALADRVPLSHAPGSAISVKLNFADQRPGFYRLTHNGVSIDEFVLAGSMAAQSAFGLVEIVLNSTLIPPAFTLLEASGRQTLIRPKTYVIRFKNRATRWRYRYEKPHKFPPTHLPDFDWIDAQSYVTRRPLGLRRRLTTLLKDGKDRPLPVPDVGLIQPEVDPAHHITNLFSDIYL